MGTGSQSRTNFNATEPSSHPTPVPNLSLTNLSQRRSGSRAKLSNSPLPRGQIQNSRDWENHYSKMDEMYLVINNLRKENNNLQFKLEVKTRKCSELEEMYNEACEVTLEYQNEFQRLIESLNEQKHLNSTRIDQTDDLLKEIDLLKAHIADLKSEREEDSQKYSHTLLQITDQLVNLTELREEIKVREDLLHEKDQRLNTQRSELIEEVGEELNGELLRLQSQRNSSDTMIFRPYAGGDYEEEPLSSKFKTTGTLKSSFDQGRSGSTNLRYIEHSESDSGSSQEHDLSKYSNDQVKIKINDGCDSKAHSCNSREEIKFLDDESDSENPPSPVNEILKKPPIGQNVNKQSSSTKSMADRDFEELLVVRIKELEELNDILGDENGILRRKIQSLEKQIENRRKFSDL